MHLYIFILLGTNFWLGLLNCLQSYPNT